MNKLNDAQIKQAELGILEHFDQMCKEKNLRYSIAFGIMIGCIDMVDLFLGMMILTYICLEKTMKSY